MIRIPKFSYLFLIAFAAISVKVFSIPLQPLPSHSKIVADVTVGHRTNDSTGQLSISNAGIQQSILPALTLLNTATITSDNSSLLISQSTVYLLFNVTDTSGIKLYIAVQLYENAAGDFTFHAGAGKELHISTNSGNCPSCMYIREQGRITETNCNGERCKHLIHFYM